MENTNELKERASKAFTSIFRDWLANGVQKHILTGGTVRVDNGSLEKNRKCPHGCLERVWNKYPTAADVFSIYGFSHYKHYSFQTAFDDGFDNGTPEAALGLLYRKRFHG